MRENLGPAKDLGATTKARTTTKLRMTTKVATTTSHTAAKFRETKNRRAPRSLLATPGTWSNSRPRQLNRPSELVKDA
ncbi:hypothetical protein [Amycolatopsis echigonensis]|uniref:Uncharacterized protein n=1 Tax=Amycolatopsis echigonensis TaxID=2576905 RepID=A0A8E1VYV9_9PSEU|nr:hypothetical protein [Amycolatopsis echigonensis]MBB2500689.1 hypothetical protein [Amycolatopsis echigonensis]